MTQTTTERLHIVDGSDWKDAVIALLESRSPYRPWRYGFGAQVGDPVAVVLNTDPPSIVTTLGRVGIDGRVDRAVVEWSDHAPSLIDLATLTAVVDFSHDQDPREVWQLHGDAAIQMQEGGYTSLLDFRFSQHPKCPRCGAERTQSALFGMPSTFDIPPWLDMRGCCRTPDNWTCTMCAHKW